ncbi:MAG TPA: alpha-2-macroglobulin family protein [Gemmatimonadales bacterium]|nr:alpha-2-macroglobulin family protein [Gemmatimonadales bacterium]
MRAISTAATLTLSSLVVSAPTPLRVLRVTPDQSAPATTVVTVTFDRPVAGSLDAGVDAKRIFTITPAVAGRIEWRDPITLRFTPAAPLSPATEYTVTVANDFAAMDGSRLDAPYRFSFRVRGAVPLTGAPAAPHEAAQYLEPDAQLEIVWSTPVELSDLSKRVYIELDRMCSEGPIIRVRAVSQRPITDQDSWRYRDAGGWQRDRSADGLRRVVRIVPVTPLPRACRGSLVLPNELDPESTSPYQRWSLATYGPFQLIAATCASAPVCPTGHTRVEFSTPVRGAELLRGVHFLPRIPFTVYDTTAASATWMLEASLKPRSGYAVVVDTLVLRDVFGQRLSGNPVKAFATSGYAPAVSYDYGMMLVERAGYRTFPVRHVNVDTLLVTTASIPDSLEALVLRAPAWNLGDVWGTIAPGATQRKVAVESRLDVPLTSVVRAPVYNAARAGAPALTAMRVGYPGDTGTQWRRGAPVALLQTTDIGVTARVGEEEAVVWVTGVEDGRPRSGVDVELRDPTGHVRAQGKTNPQGLVRLSRFGADSTSVDVEERGFVGYVSARLGLDRAVVPINTWSGDLSPWSFNVRSAWGTDRLPVSGAVFTERGIYRPGERVYVKAIVRSGSLGALRVPAAADSLRWLFRDREGGLMRDSIERLSAFGTASQVLTLGGDLPLGTYSVSLQVKRGTWQEIANTSYRVAEYRPPEFLVTVTADSTPRFSGDSLHGNVEARYLFGAPMARAAVSWTLNATPGTAWGLNIPGLESYDLGESGWWWEDWDGTASRNRVRTVATGTDTLDAAGRLTLRLPVSAIEGRPANARLQATVTDVNRQTVSASASVLVHPASFYIAARPLGSSYFWTAGTPQEIAVLSVQPDGRHVTGVRVQGTLVRREWHRVQRARDGVEEQIGEWVADTVARCNLVSAQDPVNCKFTPVAGGTYIVSFRARDERGRDASTSFYRWATGKDWIPWNDESQFKMDLVPDKTRYTVGDTATILVAAPFTDAEAWITVEREGLIEQRRMRVTGGATSLKFRITEAYAPNAFVSMVLVRGRSALPGGIADPGRPTLRVGYAELRVTPEVKRLTVDVKPAASEYRPGDSARVRIQVRDAAGRGRRSEVTLWGVDEGVLSLTGYKTPDPLDLLYQPRGVSLRLASNLVAIAPQVLEQEGASIKGEQQPGGGGGLAGGDILRSRFVATAFFLGSIETDSTGTATATAKLPDNLTTFRVMAVAVTTGDRYGHGESPLLVTRPLLARPALPRFVRLGDAFTAGVVVNQRSGGTPTVTVRARSTGVVQSGAATRTVALAAGRGSEVRFAFRDTTADSVAFRFDAGSQADSDAVLVRLPGRPVFTPRAYTVSGSVSDSASVVVTLPGPIDPERSRLDFGIGTTPLAVLAGSYRWLAVYPFDCSEQITDELLPLIAIYRAGPAAQIPDLAPERARAEIVQGVSVLSARQRPDGGIGLWSADGWTTPWLSAYAGEALLAARDAGIPVRDSVIGRLANFLYRSVHERTTIQAPIATWYSDLRVLLAEQVAAADFLSRAGRPDLPTENELLRQAAQLSWEDRLRLAQMMARRGARGAARQLMTPIWESVRVEGRRAVLPDSARQVYWFYFPSSQRPVARLLSATLAVDSSHALIGPLVETLVEQSRGAVTRWGYWNTQDFGAAAAALADFTTRQSRAARRGYEVRGAGNQVVFRSRGDSLVREVSRPLTGLVSSIQGDSQRVTLTIRSTTDAGPGTPPLFFYLTVHEVPRQRPVTPDQQGIQVERWYEDYATGKPVVSVTEGSLVRVRLWITIPSNRQFVALTDPLPAGLEAVDLSLRTTGELPGPGAATPENQPGETGEEEEAGGYLYGWYYGSWDAGWWSPFDHKELRDDRVVYVATVLWPGRYSATYIARATTPGTFMRPPAHAEEMYNPGVQGRSDGGTFTVTPRNP